MCPVDDQTVIDDIPSKAQKKRSQIGITTDSGATINRLQSIPGEYAKAIQKLERYW